MLSKVQVYSSSSTTLILDPNGREETDLIHVRNIDGLNPVKATISTSAFGSVDGSAYIGSRVDGRNLVLTLRPNPDWSINTPGSIRRILYQYFMPKTLVKLILTDDEIPSTTAEIYGYVEDFQADAFSKDPDCLISIICPDPYFTSEEPTLQSGTTAATPVSIWLDSDTDIGFNIRVEAVTGIATSFEVQFDDTKLFHVDSEISSDWSLYICSVHGKKYVRAMNRLNGAVVNKLSSVQAEYSWPVLHPGLNHLIFNSDLPGSQNWEIQFYPRYGGL